MHQRTLQDWAILLFEVATRCDVVDVQSTAVAVALVQAHHGGGKPNDSREPPAAQDLEASGSTDSAASNHISGSDGNHQDLMGEQDAARDGLSSSSATGEIGDESTNLTAAPEKRGRGTRGRQGGRSRPIKKATINKTEEGRVEDRSSVAATSSRADGLERPQTVEQTNPVAQTTNLKNTSTTTELEQTQTTANPSVRLESPQLLDISSLPSSQNNFGETTTNPSHFDSSDDFNLFDDESKRPVPLKFSGISPSKPFKPRPRWTDIDGFPLAGTFIRERIYGKRRPTVILCRNGDHALALSSATFNGQGARDHSIRHQRNRIAIRACKYYPNRHETGQPAFVVLTSEGNVSEMASLSLEIVSIRLHPNMELMHESIDTVGEVILNELAMGWKGNEKQSHFQSIDTDAAEKERVRLAIRPEIKSIDAARLEMLKTGYHSTDPKTWIVSKLPQPIHTSLSRPKFGSRKSIGSACSTMSRTVGDTYHKSVFSGDSMRLSDSLKAPSPWEKNKKKSRPHRYSMGSDDDDSITSGGSASFGWDMAGGKRRRDVNEEGPKRKQARTD